MGVIRGVDEFMSSLDKNWRGFAAIFAALATGFIIAGVFFEVVGTPAKVEENTSRIAAAQDSLREMDRTHLRALADLRTQVGEIRGAVRWLACEQSGQVNCGTPEILRTPR